MVLFQLISENPPVFNLAFGDSLINPDFGSSPVNDLISTGNRDPFKVFATVANCTMVFLNKNPHAVVYFKGSDLKRTELYTSLIVRHYKLLSSNLKILGFDGSDWVDFSFKTRFIAIMFYKTNKLYENT